MPPEVPEQVEPVNKHKDDILSNNDNSKDDKSIPIENIAKVDRPRIIDLSATPRVLPKRLENVPLLYPSVTYLHYFKRSVQHLFLTLVFDWTAIITHPINFLLTFIFFPLVTVVLFFLEIILRFISYMKLD